MTTVLFIEQEITGMGHQAVGLVTRGEDALDIVSAQEVNLVLMDINLAGELDALETALRM
ncbi:hypothetical protein JXQ70_12215 [bacterium]|nr:hypothetical protein [bacterium]